MLFFLTVVGLFSPKTYSDSKQPPIKLQYNHEIDCGSQMKEDIISKGHQVC
jgi:hypothetical protein